MRPAKVSVVLRRGLRWFGAGPAIIAFLVAALLTQQGAAAQAINIATLGQGTISYGAGAAIAQVLQEEGGFTVRIQPNSGESALLPLISQGVLDLGISGVLGVADAARGDGVFRGRPQPGLRALAVAFPLLTGIYVREDSDIRTIADLRGKRLTVGFTAMNSVGRILEAVLANGGLTLDDVAPVRVPNVVRGAEDFISGRADAFFFGIDAAKVLEADASVGGLRLLPMSDKPENIARMRDVFEYGYLSMRQPAEGRVGLDAPVPVMTYDDLIVAGRHVPAETAERVIAVLVAHRERLGRIFQYFRGFSAADVTKDLPVPYHPGVVDWRESRAADASS